MQLQAPRKSPAARPGYLCNFAWLPPLNLVGEVWGGGGTEASA